MVDVNNYLLFISAAFIICISPGPDILFVIANGLYKGAKGGVVAALGLAVGMLVHTVVVSLGLALLISSNPIILQIIKIAGAAYLLYIGYLTFKSARADIEFKQERQEVTLMQIFKRAIITNVLNPKVVIFFLAFLPQFVSAEIKNTSLQLLIYGLTFLIIGLLVDSAIGFVSGKVKDLIAKNDKIVYRLNLFSAFIFCFLGILTFYDVFLN